MNSSAASATTSDGEAFQRFLQENHDELCLGLASEKVADLLEWLKTYEVLSAVECEVIVASGPSHQAETLLKFLSTRDARDHWKPFWNGIGRCAPQLHAKWIPVIYAKLGDTGLTGLAQPKKSHSSSLSQTHSFKRHGSVSAGRTGGDHVSLSSAAQCDVATRGKLEDLEQMVEQLTLERNAASAERKEALSAAEEAMGQHYEQQKQITALQYNTDSLKSEIRSLKDRLEKKSVECEEAIRQKELFKDQRRAAIEESQEVHNMLSGLQRSHQETREQMRKQIDFYENELDRGRSRQHDFAAQENKLILAQNEANRQRELLAQLRRELDCSIPYEMKDGQLMVRSLMSSNPLEDSGVHDPRSAGGGSEISHNGTCVYPCKLDVTLSVHDVEPGLALQHGVIISDISPRGCAAMDGRLAVGDQLLEINGVSTTNLGTISDMIRGCRRKLDLVVVRHLLVPKSLRPNLAPPPPQSHGANMDRIYGTGMSSYNSGAVPGLGLVHDRPYDQTSGTSADASSICSRVSGVSMRSTHSVQELPHKNASLPNYYRPSHIHPASRQPQQQVTPDGQFAFLTGPVVAAMANNRSFSPHSMGTPSSSIGGLSGEVHPTHTHHQRHASATSPPSATNILPHRPPVRHFSETSRPTEVLTQPKLLNWDDAQALNSMTGHDQHHHLNHYMSVPDLGPHRHHPKARQRHVTSTGLAPKTVQTPLVGIGSPESLHSNSSAQPVSTVANNFSYPHVGNGRNGSALRGLKQESTLTTSSSTCSTGDSAFSTNKPRLAQAPSDIAIGPQSTGGFKKGLPRIDTRPSNIPPIELLRSSNGGRDTTPVQPEIIITGVNVGQRELTPIRLRAPQEVLSKLPASYESMQSSNGTPGSQLREVIVNRRTEESTLEDFAICGGRGNSVFISALPPWMAEEGLAVGDRMVYIGGDDVQEATFENCHFLIHCSLVYGSSLAFVVEHDPDGLRKLPKGTRDNFFVRCEFNYVNIDAGELEISRGDILNVVDTMHEDRTDSWYAFKMKGSQRTTTGGIIPSKNRASSLVIRRRSSQVSRDVDMDEVIQNFRGSSPRPASRRGSLRSNFKIKNIFKRMPSGDPVLDFNSAPLPSIAPMSLKDSLPKGYTNVQLVSLKAPRPTILLGALSDKLTERLEKAYPQTFFRARTETFSSSTAVRAGLNNGAILRCHPPLDESYNPPSGYHCLTKESFRSEDGRLCLVNPEPSYIELLEQVNIYPIVLFLQPKSEKKLRLLAMQVDNTDVPMSTARDIFMSTTDEFSKWRNRLTAVISVGTLIDRALQKIVSEVQRAQEEQNWIPVHVP